MSAYQVEDRGSNPRVRSISSRVAKGIIIKHHYSRRVSNMKSAFGLFDETETLIGAVTFGVPSSPQVARSLCPEQQDFVLELNRLVIITSEPNAASRLVGNALRLLSRPVIVVSYADRGQSHTGYVYQATNFWFAGESTPHDSEYIIDGKRVHPRTLAARGITAPREWARANNIEWVPIEPKYRYVWWVGRGKGETKRMLKLIQWSLTKDYPKNDIKKTNVDSTAAALARFL